MIIIITWHNGDRGEYEIENNLACNLKYLSSNELEDLKIFTQCGSYLSFKYVRSYYLEEKK